MHPVSLRNVEKRYHLDEIEVVALSNVSVDFGQHSFTVVAGPSGSGKTTLLNLIGCIDTPDSGLVTVAGREVQAMSDDELSDFRARHIGFVFQHFNLVPVLSAYENVEYPLVIARAPADVRKKRVGELLDAVGLGKWRHHLPGQLSGGQRQRVAIARALATGPALVLADEPTASLDSVTAAEIIALMRRMQRERDVAFVVSSHDPKVLAEADEEIHLRDGRIVVATGRPELQAGATSARRALA